MSNDRDIDDARPDENDAHDPAGDGEGSPEQLDHDDPAVPPSSGSPDKDSPQPGAPGSGAPLPPSE